MSKLERLDRVLGTYPRESCAECSASVPGFIGLLEHLRVEHPELSEFLVKILNWPFDEARQQYN